MKKYRKKRKRGIQLIAFMVMIICGVVFFQSQKEIEERTKKEQKIQAIQDKIKYEQGESERLEEQKEYQKTKLYVEEIARTKLGLVYPWEIVFEEKKEE